MTQQDDKKAAALAAAAEIHDGMLIGIGTGSTVAFLIDELGGRVRAGLRIEAVATSIASETAARTAGITVRDFAAIAAIDLAIDGVDAIDPAFRAIKGGGGAMLREKVVAAAAHRMVAIADGTKAVAALGTTKLPVEVLPFACSFVAARLSALGATVRRRDGSVTDNGNLVLDAVFGAIPDPASLATAIAAIPGALGHGLFLDEIDALYVADRGAVRYLARAATPTRTGTAPA